MRKIEFGQTVQLLANIGVVAGIVFLAVELQQNTRSQEANTYQSLMQGLADINEQRMAHPRIAAILRNSDTSFSDLDAEDFEAVEALLFQAIRYADMAYYHYERGLLTEQRLESAVGPVNGWRCTLLFREAWLGLSDNFVESFRQFVDQKLAAC